MQEADFRWIGFMLAVQPPSLNVLLRMHWLQQRRLKETYGWLLTEQLLAMDESKLPRAQVGEPRGLHITVYRPRLFDEDNHLGGLKPLIDALKEVRAIFDDSQAMLFKNGYVQLRNRDADHRVLWGTTCIFVGVLHDRAQWL